MARPDRDDSLSSSHRIRSSSLHSASESSLPPSSHHRERSSRRRQQHEEPPKRSKRRRSSPSPDHHSRRRDRDRGRGRSGRKRVRSLTPRSSEEEEERGGRRHSQRSHRSRDHGRRRRRREEEDRHDNGSDDEDDDKSKSRRSKRSSRRERRRQRARSSPSQHSHDDRPHQHHGQPQPHRHAERNAPPMRAAGATGIVSDDDENYTTTAAPLATAGHRSNQHHTRNRSPSSHEDMVGHFEGGPGTVIADRYRIVQQVGLGTFGRVVSCLDLKQQQQQRHPPGRSTHGSTQKESYYVAIKIVRNVKRYCESAKIEADIVNQINRRGGRGVNNCVILHDAFHFSGHFCLVFESLGPSLYDFLKRNDHRPFPMVCVQDFTIQLLETMEFLHSFGLIHADLKIENILLMNARETTYRNQRVPQSTRIKLIDFGGACYDNAKKSSVINTRQYRAPEVIMEAGWSMPSDMWSLGCILAELYRGELLFPTHENVEHLALIERTMGPFPRLILQRATKYANEAFDQNGRHRMGRVLKSESLAFVKDSPSLKSIVCNREDDWFLHLLSMILQIDPEKRCTAHECLRFLARIRRDRVQCA